jgi:hypothetical protein
MVWAVVSDGKKDLKSSREVDLIHALEDEIADGNRHVRYTQKAGRQNAAPLLDPVELSG